ncbi:MAG: tRNA epoxyqueuosine(34) reductase QueG [Alistipes sp.]|nr:tRNA epoxyqueuosine(34) reductase QueG [Alistipes sp.]
MISRKIIINIAREAGFDLVGIARAEHLSSEHNRFNEWMLEGNASTLDYLKRNIDKRFDASILVDGARSVIVCAISYLSHYSRGYKEGWRTKVASYALARDYHLTIKEMLTDVAERLKEHYPTLRFRAFTDSAPLAEKSYAVRAGLGWIGRNSLLVTPEHGSMIHLGELVINEEVDQYNTPMDGVGCGECRRCVEACPNGAILENRTIDTRRCISCRTIEREANEAKINLDGWIFGCDGCQVVCPYNKRAPLHTNPKFDPLYDPTALDSAAWLRMSDEEFKAMASTTAMTRAGLERIQKNIEAE